MAMSDIIMVGTMATTPINGAAPWAAIAVSVALGGALLASAPQRVLSELFLLKPARMIQAAEAGAPVPLDALESATRQADAEAARGLSADGGDLAGRGHTLLALYRDPASPNGVAELDAARAAFLSVLSRAPLSPYVWDHLSYTDVTAHRLREAVAAWRRSVRAGPFDTALIPPRFESGLALHRYMDAASRREFDAQVRLYAQWNLPQLAEQTVQFDAADIVRPILAQDAAELAELNRLIPLLKARL